MKAAPVLCTSCCMSSCITSGPWSHYWPAFWEQKKPLPVKPYWHWHWKEPRPLRQRALTWHGEELHSSTSGAQHKHSSAHASQSTRVGESTSWSGEGGTGRGEVGGSEGLNAVAVFSFFWSCRVEKWLVTCLIKAFYKKNYCLTRLVGLGGSWREVQGKFVEMGEQRADTHTHRDSTSHIPQKRNTHTHSH